MRLILWARYVFACISTYSFPGMPIWLGMISALSLAIAIHRCADWSSSQLSLYQRSMKILIRHRQTCWLIRACIVPISTIKPYTDVLTDQGLYCPYINNQAIHRCLDWSGPVLSLYQQSSHTQMSWLIRACIVPISTIKPYTDVLTDQGLYCPYINNQAIHRCLDWSGPVLSLYQQSSHTQMSWLIRACIVPISTIKPYTDVLTDQGLYCPYINNQAIHRCLDWSGPVLSLYQQSSHTQMSWLISVHISTFNVDLIIHT